jgi:hypothetical protein
LALFHEPAFSYDIRPPSIENGRSRRTQRGHSDAALPEQFGFFGTDCADLSL